MFAIPIKFFFALGLLWSDCARLVIEAKIGGDMNLDFIFEI